MTKPFARHLLALGSLLATAYFAGPATGPAAAAELPKATQKMLKALELKADILEGLDKELAIPQEWVEAAKKEKEVVIYTTARPKQWARIHSVLKERYPYIQFKQEEVNTANRRWVRPLAAFKEGRIVTDVVMDLSGSAFQFREAGALIPLDDLPGYKNFPEQVRQPDHITVAVRSRYWCMSYNTNALKKEDLPKTWDDLVTSDKFDDKRLALINRANLWLLNVWAVKGEAWGEKFMDALFKLDPQRRKEGLNAGITLVSLGEVDATVPSAMNRVGPLALKGAPVGFHCPEPVPYTVSDMGIFKGSPHTHAAKIFVNWYLSKEGQIAQYWADRSPPAHKELLRKEFLYYPDAVAGKKLAILDQKTMDLSPQIIERWNQHWLAAQ